MVHQSCTAIRSNGVRISAQRILLIVDVSIMHHEQSAVTPCTAAGPRNPGHMLQRRMRLAPRLRLQGVCAPVDMIKAGAAVKTLQQALTRSAGGERQGAAAEQLRVIDEGRGACGAAGPEMA